MEQQDNTPEQESAPEQNEAGSRIGAMMAGIAGALMALKPEKIDHVSFHVHVGDVHNNSKE